MSGATRTRPGLEWTDLAPWRPYDEEEDTISGRYGLVRVEIVEVTWVSDRYLAVRLDALPEGGPELNQHYLPPAPQHAQGLTHALITAYAGEKAGHTGGIDIAYLELADRLGWSWDPCGTGPGSKWAAWHDGRLVAVAATTRGDRLHPGDDYTREQTVYRALDGWIDSALNRGRVAEQIIDELTALDTPAPPLDEATQQARATEVDIARWTNELDALGANTPDMRDALLALAAAEPRPETVRIYAESSARIAERVAAPTTWRDVWEDLGMAWRDLVRVVLRR